ncbi:MAG: pilus assembly protein PilM, partial [Culicoidibacterales bacterium]
DGKILNEGRLAATLADAIAHRKIKAKHAIVTMNSSQIINRDLFIPEVESDELETVIRFELQQYLPINLADYQIRYLLTDEWNDEGKMRIFVSAFPERMLSAYYQTLKQADFQPHALELPLVAIRKILAHTQINEFEQMNESTVAFLDIGQENINISIYDQGNIDFTRLIRNGGQVIDESLRREGVKYDQVIEYKHEILDVSHVDFANQHPEVKQSLDQIMTEAEKFLQFYRNNNQSKQLSNVFIYGGCAQIKGLASYLAEIFKVPTHVVETIDNVEFAQKTEQFESMPSYFNAISSLVRVEG